MSDGFRFDITAKRTRLSDGDLVASLQSAAEALGGGYFSSTRYDGLPGSGPHSATIIERFGSWKKALALIGISGARERRYAPEELVTNLETVWKELTYPPGKRQIAKLGQGISEGPYKHHWGSVRAACEAIAAFHEGKITRERLLAGNTNEPTRTTIPLKDRWTVLKRDNYRCTICGASPSNDHKVELEVDHITPVKPVGSKRGGGNDVANLQTLCRKCNQGKKNR